VSYMVSRRNQEENYDRRHHTDWSIGQTSL
jgi:hypothetical protein